MQVTLKVAGIRDFNFSIWKFSKALVLSSILQRSLTTEVGDSVDLFVSVSFTPSRMEIASRQVFDQYNIRLALAIALQVTASAKKIGKLEFRKFSLQPSYSTD